MRLATAYHEAAHGCVASLLGYDILDVRCLPHEAYVQAGQFRGAAVTPITGSAGDPLIKLKMRLAADVQFALSGAVGESEYTGESIRTILSRCTDDRRIARKAAVAYALAQPEWHPDAYLQVLHDFMQQTRRLVRSNWGVITTLAEKLALNGRLDGRDVLRAIEFADRKAA